MIGRGRDRATLSLSRVAVILAVLGAVALVVPTGGFSSVNADRSVNVAVVPDSEAYLGIDVDLAESDGGQYGRTAISFVAFCVEGPSDGSAEVTTLAAKEGDPSEPMLVEWNATVPVDTVVVKNGSGPEVDWVTGTAAATEGTVASNDGTPRDLNGNDVCPAGERLFDKVPASKFGAAGEVDATATGDALTVEVTNRFDHRIDATVTVESGDGSETDRLQSIESGETRTTQPVSVDCDAPGPVTVRVDAGGSGVSVDLDRSVCDGDGTVYE